MIDYWIVKARVRLIKRNPFFGYLALSLNIREAKKGELDAMPTMGVDARGNLIYRKEFIDTLTQEQLTFVIAHEVMHVALFHLTRLGTRQPMVWNIATDIVVNNILLDNVVSGVMEAPKIILYDKSMKELNAEEIYEKLTKKLGGSGNKSGTGKPSDGLDGMEKKRFDVHTVGNNGKELAKTEQRALERARRQRVASAAQVAKSQGKLPSSIEKLVDYIIGEPKVSWKEVLLKYVQSEIPFDFTYSRPSKRSRAVGTYMPSIVRESVDIMIAIDTSGSISD